MTDLSGVRVIAYLKEEYDTICDLIKDKNNFDIHEITDKEEMLAPDEFGYRSMHFIVSYNDDRLKLNDFKPFAGLKAEVQVRTLLQHAWAAIDWKLRYKTDIGVPDDIRRRLYRISALLEGADDDFSRVNRMVGELRASYENQIQTGNLAIEVNQESLEVFLGSSAVVAGLKSMAEDQSYVIGPPNPRSLNPLLNLSHTLNAAGIIFIADLEQRLVAAEPGAAQFLEKVHAAWYTPGESKKLVIDLGGLIRLFVIGTSDNAVALTILKRIPFGPKLNKAVCEIVDQLLLAARAKAEPPAEKLMLIASPPAPRRGRGSSRRAFQADR